MIRRLLLASAGLVGAALLAIDARWTGAEALEFRWAIFGRSIWSGDRAEFSALIALHGFKATVFAILVSLILGVLGARHLGRRTMIATALFALALFTTLDPSTLRFLATRGAESAGGYLDAGDLIRAVGWGLIATSLVGWFARASAPTEPSITTGSSGVASDGRRWVIAACLIAGLLPALLSQALLNGEPVTNDGAAYRYQSELFASGELTRDIGPLADFFPARQIQPGPQAFSKYPPAHSALLAIGQTVGLPRLLPVLLAAVVPYLTWLLALRLKLGHAHRAAILVAVSPVLLGVQTLWLSHATSVPMCLLFCYAVLVVRDFANLNRRRAVRWAIIGGVAISIVFAARPLTAVAVALPFALHFLATCGSGSLALCGCALLGALPVGVAFLWVNMKLTGSPFKTSYGLYADSVSPNDRWGLVNLETALMYTRYNIARLGAWMHGMVPGLWLLIVGATSATRPRSASLLWIPTVSLLAFYSLHRFHGIPWVGPLYLVETVPLLAVLSAAGWNSLERKWGSSAMCLLACVVLLSSAQLLTSHLVLAGQRVDARSEPYRIASEMGIERGVVFVSLGTEGALKRFPLPPPLRSDRLVFARDLGRRNAELLSWLGNPPSWKYDPDRSELIPDDL